MMKLSKVLRFIGAIFLTSLVMGCAAQMIRSPGGIETPFAPSNEKSLPGTIRYLNQGAGFVVKQRREDAYKKMFAACNGRYTISSEGPRSEGGIATAVGNSLVFRSSEYWYISFQCE